MPACRRLPAGGRIPAIRLVRVRGEELTLQQALPAQATHTCRLSFPSLALQVQQSLQNEHSLMQLLAMMQR